MPNENRHPGEGAAAGNVLDTDVPSPLRVNLQEIGDHLSRQRPHIQIWTKKPDGKNDGRYFGDDIDCAVDYVVRQSEAGFNGYYTFNIPTEDCGVNGPSNRSTPAWPNLLQISAEEWQFANATPGVIIEYLIYRCVGTLIAAGGTGKTTFIEWLAIHVILGLGFAGRKVVAPGRVVLLTAEDSREMLVARLRSIFFEMFPQGTISDAERDATLNAIRDGMVIIDVSANVQRLTCVERDVVRVDHAAVDGLTALISPNRCATLLANFSSSPNPASNETTTLFNGTV